MSPTISRVAVSGTAASSGSHQHDVDHEGFVDDQQTAVERSVRITPEAAGGGVDLEQPVDCPGLLPGGLAQSSGGAAGRRAQDELDAFGGQDAQDGVDQRRLAHARSSRDDDGLRRQRQPHRPGLARRQRQAALLLDEQGRQRRRAGLVPRGEYQNPNVAGPRRGPRSDGRRTDRWVSAPVRRG